jgi:hypothetical protein
MRLVTSGCSFTDPIAYPHNWAVQLSKILNIPHVPLGYGGQGNGLISRKIIHYLSEVEDTEDLLVAIMWSGHSRHEIYLDDSFDGRSTKFVDFGNAEWAIMSPWHETELAKNFYRSSGGYWHHVILTYEHILRTQWYLQSCGIKYVMLTYMDEVLREAGNAPPIAHLWNMIDHSKFITPDHSTWCKHSGIPFRTDHQGIDEHPTRNHSIAYTQEVIIPYLKENNLIQTRHK